jgi:PAS domain S-box-containing protein
MSSRQQRIQTLYEISLAIRSRETLEKTADRALAAYLQKLNCSVGAVFRVTGTVDGTELSLVASIPSRPERNELFRRASNRLADLVRTSETRSVSPQEGSSVHPMEGTVETARENSVQYAFEEPLPVAERVDDIGQYHLMELPEFGVILLGKRGGTVDSRTVSSLTPLNEKLAQACQSNLTERQLREQRNRFEAVFAAIPEPVVNVVVEDGTKQILRANEAFEETFAGDEEPIRGCDLDEVLVPDGQSPETEALVKAVDRGKPFENELQRETVTGHRHFLFSGVPVTASEKTEYFGVYIDITEQKEREETLEELYEATQDLLGKQSRQQVCTHAVETIESVLGYSAVGLHLYQRDSEALEPIAVSEQVHEKMDGGPAGYTDRDTIVWRAYEGRQPIRIDDTHQFDGKLPSEGTPTRSAVILPVGIHGVLITSAYEPNAFDGRDVYFLRLLSQLIEVALDRTVYEEGLTAVQRATRDILHADTHEEMAERVLEEIPDVLDLPVAGIWKHQPTSQQLQPVYHTEQAAELLGDQPAFSKDNSVAWKTFTEGTTSVISDVSEVDEAHNPETPIEGEINVPIGDFGMLTAGSTYKDSFTNLDAEILEILATNLEAIAEVIDTRQDVDLLDQVIARILRHNVRNKLTPILGYASTIAAEAEAPISEYAQSIVDHCEKLEQTATHAREMREVVQNRGEISTVSLGTTVRTAATSVDKEFPDGQLVSHIAETPDVTAHPELGTAIRHLIQNGFEHNNSDTPSVEVVVEQRPDGPTVEVTDNGPGIDTYELEILDKHGESALEHGSGVGLWIVDRITKYSKALLEFETADTGTKAKITFPSHTDTTNDG